MKELRKHSQTSNRHRVKILDSSSTTGAGLTGLDHTSSGLIISTITDNEATATAYTVTGSTIETISTLGTYAAPTATKCRFKEVDATNHPGLYEVQFADARLAVASADRLVVTISGATNAVETDFEIELDTVNDQAASAITAAEPISAILPAATQTSIDNIEADTNELQTNQGNWLTATGFATPTNVTDSQTAVIAEIDANETKIDAIGNLVGAGAITHTITIKDGSNDPISNVEVWVTTDLAGSNVVAGTLITDAFGEVIFYLDAGTYYVWRNKPGVTFTSNPVQTTVA